MNKPLTQSVVALAAVTFLAVAAQADVITFKIDMQYTGDTPNGYLELTFSDEAPGLAAGEVKLTLTSHLEGGEDAKTLGFNFDPGQGNDTDDASVIANLTFGSEVKTPNTTGSPSITKGLNDQQGDLGPRGGFDVLFNFGGGPQNQRFNDDDMIMYVLSSTVALNANMFNATSDEGALGVFAAAHIQDTDGNAGSGKIKDGDGPELGGSIPTPAALPAGLGMLMLAASQRRRRRAA